MGVDVGVLPEEVEVFVFQAEDGIRYWSVTGVQTCTLPISAAMSGPTPGIASVPIPARSPRVPPSKPPATAPVAVPSGALVDFSVPMSRTPPMDSGSNRSEERRVGKECRAGGRPGRLRR